MRCSMLLPLVCSFLLLEGATSQTSAELSSRYGEPDMERFPIRPGISLTVEYGANRLACRMVIEPTRSASDEPAKPKYMRPEIVSEIIDELVPHRGSETSHGAFVSGGNCVLMSEFEKFSIARATLGCTVEHSPEERSVTIVRKDAECKKVSK